MLKEEEYCTVNPFRKEFPKEEGGGKMEDKKEASCALLRGY